MKELKERNKAIRRWRKRGLSYHSIGIIFDISRQRTHQIDHKKQEIVHKIGFWRRLWETFKKLIR